MQREGQLLGKTGPVLASLWRIRGRRTFPMLVEAVACLFAGARPDLHWIRQDESPPCPLPCDQIRFTA